MRALGVLVLALLLTASAAGAQSSPGHTAEHTAAQLGGLTQHEYDVAVRVAREQTSARHAHVTGAWAIAVPDAHPHATTNTGHPCRSATVVRVWLIGSFPRIVVSPPPGATKEQTIVTAMRIDVDAASGSACLISVATGPQHPGPAWTRLHS